jgi:hypothetical protein
MKNITEGGTSYEDEIFENRNKAYGAYLLRKSYPKNLTIAFGLTVILCIALIIGFVVYDYQQKKLLLPYKIKPEMVVAPWNKKHQLLYLRVQHNAQNDLSFAEETANIVEVACANFVFSTAPQEESKTKMKVYFNPNQVAAYRFLGYEQQLLTDKITKNWLSPAQDTSQELKIGYLVAGLYEIVPAKIDKATATTDTATLQGYQKVMPTTTMSWTNDSTNLLQLSFKYKMYQEQKDYQAQKTKLVNCYIPAGQAIPLSYGSPNCQFAVAVTQAVVK